jgi:hypothetical protein
MRRGRDRKAQKKVRIRKEELEIQQPTVREIDPASREYYGATSATRVKIGPIGRLPRLLHRHDTSGVNCPSRTGDWLRVRHARAVARAISIENRNTQQRSKAPVRKKLTGAFLGIGISSKF